MCDKLCVYLLLVCRGGKQGEWSLQSPLSLPARRETVNGPSEARRSIFIILDRSEIFSLASFFSSTVIGIGFSRDGKKKGAFSGSLGASVGLLRCLMRLRWRRVCHLLLGTRLSVIISELN